jgi:VanZ family protein
MSVSAFLIPMFLKYNYKALLWAVLILIVCSIPGNELPDISSWNFPGMDKAVHVFLYFIFTILLVKGFRQQSSFRKLQKHFFIFAIATGIAYGLLIEIFQQTLLVGRSAEINDVLANTGGTALGIIYSLLFRPRE